MIVRFLNSQTPDQFHLQQQKIQQYSTRFNGNNNTSGKTCRSYTLHPKKKKNHKRSKSSFKPKGEHPNIQNISLCKSFFYQYLHPGEDSILSQFLYISVVQYYDCNQ